MDANADNDNLNVSKTTIKKSNKVATISQPPQHNQPQHQRGDETIDSLTINDMIHDIEMLDEEAHEQIYLLLRGFKPASFFTTDRGGGGTHFDRTLLTDRQTNELYRTVQFCKENMMRKQVLLSAKQEMEQDANIAVQRMAAACANEEAAN
jgi:hypothetical protein